MDFSDFRSELDTKEHNDRFFAGVPNIPKQATDKMAIYQLFLQHIIYSLKPGGKAAVVVPTGFITAQSGIDKKSGKTGGRQNARRCCLHAQQYLCHHRHQRFHLVYRQYQSGRSGTD